MSEEIVEEVQEKKVKKEIKLVEVSSSGELSFSNHEELGRAAAFAMATDLAPKQLKEKGQAAVCAALLACKQYDLPQKAMGQMAYIHGRLTFYGSLVSAIAEKHPQYGEKIVKFIDKDQNEICLKNKNIGAEVFACVILARRKGENNFSEFYFSQVDAENAELLNPKKKEYVDGKPTGKYILNNEAPWIRYKRDMFYHKANKRMVESLYASALEGVNYHEDLIGVFDNSQTERDVSPSDTGLKNILDQRKEEFREEG